MWMKQVFEERSMDFERICKTRIRIGIGVVFLGALAVLVVGLSQGDSPIRYLKEGTREFIANFYLWMGIGLVAGGLVKIAKGRRLLRNPDLKRKQEIMETDERNRELGLRCWAYSGYTMFLLLYLGILASGFVSATLAWVLLTVSGVYGLLLILFRMILQRRM